MRPAYELDTRQEEVRRWILEERLSQQDVLARLRTAGLSISRTTLGRRLADWDISVAPKANDGQELREKIAECHSLRLTDAQAIEKLRNDGTPVAKGAFARIRKDMGLFKQVKASALDTEEQGIREALLHEFANGTIGKFTRYDLHRLMRAKYNHVGRCDLEIMLGNILAADDKSSDRIFKIACEMNPENAIQRIPTAAGEARRIRDRERARRQGIPARRLARKTPSSATKGRDPFLAPIGSPEAVPTARCLIDPELRS